MRIQPSLRTGANRTGMASSDEHLRREALDPPRDLGPTSRGTSDEIARIRIHYARVGLPFGTMPALPGTARELLPFFDLLGARLQFERTGTRWYDALISKLEAFGSFHGGPSLHDLLQIRDEELTHVRMLERMISELHGDATVVTPCAERQAIAARGVGDVLVDPRTSLLDGLEAIMVAELADHEEWLGLIDLARDLRHEEIVHAFQSAQLTEEEHLSKVRRWISAGRAAARGQLAD